jgi:predicted nucleic-acid-binding protein
MVTVDTNIVVRLLTQDDELQYQQSLEIFQSQDVFIVDTVILETEIVDTNSNKRSRLTSN